MTAEDHESQSDQSGLGETGSSDATSTDATAGVEAESRGRGPVGRALSWLVGLLVGWIVLSVAVLFWQPGRFTQVGVALVLLLIAAWLPKKLVSRIVAGLGAAVFIAAVFYAPSYLLSRVVEFEIRSAGLDAGKSIYLVQTDLGAKAADDPGETFRNDDSPLFWKVNSSDLVGVFNALEGHRVRARVIGIRFADRSLYRNIIWVHDLGLGGRLGPG